MQFWHDRTAIPNSIVHLVFIPLLHHFSGQGHGDLLTCRSIGLPDAVIFDQSRDVSSRGYGVHIECDAKYNRQEGDGHRRTPHGRGFHFVCFRAM